MSKKKRILAGTIAILIIVGMVLGMIVSVLV